MCEQVLFLYFEERAELGALTGLPIREFWWVVPGLNRQLEDYESTALPIELTTRKFGRGWRAAGRAASQAPVYWFTLNRTRVR